MDQFELDIKGKVAVITGAGGVLCSMFAKTLAREGAKVALLNRTLAHAEVFANEITAEGFTAKAYQVDVTNKKSLEAAHQQVLADFGKCDILINGAGGNHPSGTTTKEYFETGDEKSEDILSFFDLDEEGIRFVFDLNFMGTLLTVQVFAADMIGREGCTIINISSINADRPLTKIPAYSGAKAAISNLTQWLAVHFSRTGIRVNAIMPGFFVTRQNQRMLFEEDGTPTARTRKILASTPMDRFGDPKELNGALLFLVNEKASSFVTGAVIPVDGGFTAYSGV